MRMIVKDETPEKRKNVSGNAVFTVQLVGALLGVDHGDEQY
jgi:hypothetical protein